MFTISLLSGASITEVTGYISPAGFTNFSNVGFTPDNTWAYVCAYSFGTDYNDIKVSGKINLPRDSVPYETYSTIHAKGEGNLFTINSTTTVSTSAAYTFAAPYSQSIYVTAQGTAFVSRTHTVENNGSFFGTSGKMEVDSASFIVRYVFAPDLHIKTPNNSTSYGGRTNAWSNPQQVSAADGVKAIQSIGFSGTNDTLRCKQFNFAVPSAATIRGINGYFVFSLSGAGALGLGGEISLLKSGVPVGSKITTIDDVYNTTSGNSYFALSTNLWGTTWTPGDINNSNFGVDITLWTGVTATPTIHMDAVYLQVIADTNSSMLYLGKTPVGYESPAVQITKIINIGGISPEYGYKNTNPKAYIHTPENLYGWEAGNVTLRKSVITPNPEFSHSITSVDIWQLHYRTPQRADYGYESMSVVASDLTYDAGWKVKNTSLTQRHYLNPVSSEYSWKLDKYILYYDAVRSPTNSKYGWSSVTNRLYQDHYFGAYDSDYDFEIDSIRVRDFTITPVPLRRTVKVLREARKVIVVQQRRTIVV